MHYRNILYTSYIIVFQFSLPLRFELKLEEKRYSGAHLDLRGNRKNRNMQVSINSGWGVHGVPRFLR